MSSGTPIGESAVAGIHVQQARDVMLRAGGDIVAGDKTTIHNYYGPNPQNITKAPYKFLSYYDIGDRDIFFGRDAVIDELAGKIPRHKVLIINGQSGSGKTSLINAGLIPRLAENDYLYVYFRDYTNPLEQLREYFRDHPDFAVAEADQLSLLQTLRAIRRQQQSPVVVIFDQFERFLINVAVESRREFLQQLRECLDSDLTSDELNLVISLRDDFYGKLLLEAEAIIPTFGTDSHHHNLRTLNREEARQAIIEPLKHIPNIGFDSKFVDDVLLPHLMGQAAGEAKIEPPQLQIVCNQLYEAARDRYSQQLADGEPVRIGFELYHELGETEGMLRDYLDDVVRRITCDDPRQIAIVRSTLKLMIETTGTRKFESVDEISADLPDVRRAETEKTIQRLQESRVLEAKRVGHRTEYSLSHEFMVAKVQSWYDERELQRKKAKDTLARGLVRWTSTRALLDDAEMEAIQQWLPNASNQDDVRDLLTQSSKRRTRLKWQRRTAYAAVTFAVLLMPIAVVGWIKSVSNAKKLSEQVTLVRQQAATTELKVGLELCSNGQRHEGLLWLAKSLQTAPDEASDLQTMIRENLGAWSQSVDQLIGWQRYDKVAAISPNGERVATLSSQGDVQFRDTMTGELLGKLNQGAHSFRALAFGHDHQFVTAFDGGTIMFWDVRDGKPIGSEISDAGEIESNGLALSRDGKLLLTAADAAQFRVWNLETHEFATFAPEGIAGRCVAISPDGNKIATGGLDCGFVLDAETHETVARVFLEGGWNTIETVAFSPDAKRLVAGNGRDAQMVLVDEQIDLNLKKLQPTGVLIPDGGKIVAFHDHAAPESNSGIEIVTSNGKDVQIWRLNSESAPGVLLDHGRCANAIAINPDGDTLVTARADGIIRFWDFNGLQPYGSTIQNPSGVDAVAFSPDGTIVLAAGSDGVIRFWSELTRKSEREISLPLPSRTICTLGLDADGKRLKTVSGDGIVESWNVDTAQRDSEVIEPIADMKGVRAGSLSSDGKSLVIVLEDGSVRCTNLDTREIQEITTGQIAAATFFRGSKQVATIAADGILRFRDADTGKSAGSGASPLPEKILAATFTPDGKMVATSSDGNVLRLFDSKTGKRQAVFPPFGDEVTAISIDGSNSTIVTASGEQDSILHFWNIATNSAMDEAIPHSGLVKAVALRREGDTLVTVSDNGLIQFLNRHGGSTAGESFQPVQSLIVAAALSADGQYVVIATRNDSLRLTEVSTLNEDTTVQVWSLMTRTTVGRPIHHKGSVLCLALSSEGKRVVISSENGAQIWHVGTGQPIGLPLQNQNGIFALAFSPDDQRVVTASAGNTAEIWHVPSAIEGSAERISLWIELITRGELDRSDSVRSLQFDDWKPRWQQKYEHGK